MYCSNCGKELPTAANFCSYCVVNLNNLSQAKQETGNIATSSTQQIIGTVTEGINEVFKFATKIPSLATTAVVETTNFGAKVMKSELVKDAAAAAVVGAIAGSPEVSAGLVLTRIFNRVRKP